MHEQLDEVSTLRAISAPKYAVLSTQYWRLFVFAFCSLLFLLLATPVLADPPTTPEIHTTARSDWPALLFVFMLATFIGLGVITRVSRLLHTPLMSLTNAISAIAAVGAIAIAGADHPLPIRILGAI